MNVFQFFKHVFSSSQQKNFSVSIFYSEVYTEMKMVAKENEYHESRVEEKVRKALQNVL